MLKITFLLWLVVQCLLVHGNQLTLIPLQTCPHTCNQGCQPPVNIPVLQQPITQQTPTFVVQQATNNNQPYFNQQPANNQPYFISQATNNNPQYLAQQPANNNQFYSQPIMLQKDLTASVQNNQLNQNNEVMNQLNQLYMNKLMSNPTVQTILDQNKLLANPTTQTILDPNTNLYSQLGVEIPRQVHNIPKKIPNAENAPHVVNNYYILPPEYFENGAVKATKHQEPQKREKSGHRRPTHDKHRRRHDSGESGPEVRRKQNSNYRRENHRRSELAHESETKHSGEEREGHKKRRKSNGRHGNTKRDGDRHASPIEHPRKVNSDQNRERYPDAMDRTHERPRPHQRHEMHRPNIIIKIKERPKHSSSESFSPKVDSSEKSAEKIENIPKLPRNSKDEAIIQEFQEKFPAIPEEVVRKLLSYLKRQLQKQQLGHPPLYNPNANFPLRYDQLLPNFNFHEPFNHWQRPNKRNRTKKPKSHINSQLSNVESTTPFELITTVPPATEKAKTIIEITTEANKAFEPKSTNNKTTLLPNTEPDVEILETTTTYSPVPELGTENSVLDVSNGLIDDYYPDFTNDPTYFESEEVYNVRNLRDDRYYYTTDRNYESRKSPSMHYRNSNKLKQIHKILEESVEDVLRKPFETTTQNYDAEQEIHYRTPPTLESPDFITKQIVKQKPENRGSFKEINKHMSYKSSTYSEAKNPSRNDAKNHKNNGKKLKPDIETVYAHSKVVKYGKTNEESSENVTPVVTYYLPDNMQYEEDGKTVIIAKSIPADHFW